MAEQSAIAWTDGTFNPVIGCTKVSAACDFCYAAEWASKYYPAVTWGEPGKRAKLARTSPGTWAAPLRWNKKAEKDGVSMRVFCASLSDVFDSDWNPQWRADLWDTVRATPWLDWQMLTKRPQNIAEMLPADWGAGYPNVWLGTTAENQTEYDRRHAHLMAVPAVVHFFSIEPMLGSIGIGGKPHGDWYICGGESGSHRRGMSMEWVEELRGQVMNRGAAFFFKQDVSHKPGKKGRASDALWACKQFPQTRRNVGLL